MEMAGIAAPLRGKSRQNVPLIALLRLNTALKKSLFSRKFYQEINDKILASTSTLDASLYFICYFTLLLSSVLNNKQRILAFVKGQKENLSRVLARFFSQDNQKGTISFDEEKSDAPMEKRTTTAKPSSLAVHLKAVSSYISDVRIFNRLVEAIKYMPWIIDEFAALTNPASAVPRLDRLINLGQAINCLILELLENLGWLSDHNWIGTSDNDWWCMEAYIWSSRVWGAYIAVEIIELLRRYPASKRDKNWRISLFTQAVQLPLVVHWSLYEGCLSPFWVGLCGTGASWFGFQKVLKTINLS
ncbi:hypothetical protein OXX59_003641 [Metschnikowia pulcherrima]